VVEGARLESVYTSKGYRGFESLTLRMPQEKFFVYILQSMKDFSFYIGQTNDLDYRMSKHCDGMSKYTASKRPLRLVYFEMYSSRREALLREKQLKAWKNAERYRQLISRWRNETL
jgi:putative endonuclease